MSNIFVTGGTGYIGGHLLPELIARGHMVRALVRKSSESKLARGAVPVIGNALDASTFRDLVAPSDTFIQLVGVAHPSPSKAAEFQRVDLASVRASSDAAKHAKVRHFIYLSVAQPAPVMRDYVAVRGEGERLLRESGIPCTFVRPWYVLGPTHRWPYAILPLYWLAMLVPSSRATAQRLYPVKLRNVVRAIANAVDSPPDGARIIENPELRRA
ncbi:MAG TPA: NAD(P)H-binding protein [Thermoanaerobaculia bacterium]